MNWNSGAKDYLILPSTLHNLITLLLTFTSTLTIVYLHSEFFQLLVNKRPEPPSV